MKTEATGYIAAAKAGMDEKTARKYVKAGKLPSELVTIQFPPRVKAGWGHDAGYSDSIN